MGRGKSATAESFGERILRLAGDRSLALVAREAALPYRLVWRWSRRTSPPPGMRDRITKLEKALGGSLLDHEPGEEPTLINRIGEGAAPYEGAPRRYGQPITEESLAVQMLGRLQHYLAAIDDANEVHRLRMEEIMRLCRQEIEQFRHDLLRKIEHDDKGRKV